MREFTRKPLSICIQLVSLARLRLRDLDILLTVHPDRVITARAPEPCVFDLKVEDITLFVVHDSNWVGEGLRLSPVISFGLFTVLEDGEVEHGLFKFSFYFFVHHVGVCVGASAAFAWDCVLVIGLYAEV